MDNDLDAVPRAASVRPGAGDLPDWQTLIHNPGLEGLLQRFDATVGAHHCPATPRTVVLVEGESDRLALETLARRLGQDLTVDGAEIVVMSGITNTRAFARRLGPLGEGARLAGLYDSPDEGKLRRGLAEAGLPRALDPDGLRHLGFFGCIVDLEDELIRAVGLDGVESVIEAEGEAHSLRLLGGMPAQHGWTRDEVTRRFLTSQAGRKARYARRLVEALDLDRAPEPLTGLLAHIGGDPGRR